MKTLKIIFLAILLNLMLVAAGFTHGTGDHEHHDNEHGIQVAEVWVNLVDTGQYKVSWKTAARVFKSSITSSQWTKTVKSVRDPLGKLLSRDLFHDQYTTTLPGMPDGEYLVLRYIAKYENKSSAVETLTVQKDPNGNWKVAGYFIK